jgi:hypothetical protein
MENNIAIWPQKYQIARRYNTMVIKYQITNNNSPNFLNPSPSKIYQYLPVWYENNPPGNPDLKSWSSKFE